MHKISISLLAVAGTVFLTIGAPIGSSSVQAADTPPLTKESKPAASTMSGSEQKGSNVGRNANTKPTAAPKK